MFGTVLDSRRDSRTLVDIQPPPQPTRRRTEHVHAVDQPILAPRYADSGLRNGTPQENLSMVAEIYRSSDYGSEGWGFESLRARNIIRRLACGNAGRAPFKICPLWTPGAPGVLVCFGAVRAGVRGGVLVWA